MTYWISIRTWIVALWAIVGLSFAESEAWVVDSGAMNTRQQAVALRQEVLAVALEARVLRVARSESGWSWKVRADGLSELGAAREVGSMMAQQAGSADLFVLEGEVLRAIERIVPDGSLQVVVPVSPPPSEDAAEGVAERGDIDALLARVRRAHGAGTDLKERFETARAVHFRFQREVPQGEGKLVVWHDYYRRGTWIRLEVRVLEGEGKSSLTMVRPETGAWVRVGDEKAEKVTTGRALGAISAFSPADTLGRSLHFGQIAGNGTLKSRNGGTLEVSLDSRGKDDGRVTLRVEPVQHRIESLLWEVEEDALKWSYSDYRELEGGGVVPYAAALSKNGAAVERISVLALSLSEEADESLFDPVKAFE